MSLTLSAGSARAGLRLLASATMLALLCSCMAGIRLRTSEARPDDAGGTYTVYFQGCRYSNDIETMALLVDASAPYRIDLVTLPTSYRVRTGLEGAAAMHEAKVFIRCSIYDTGRSLVRRIVDPSGRTIAYEVKPLYSPLELGADEVLLTDYVLHDGLVRVYLRLDPRVERMRQFDRPGRGDK